MIGPSISSNKEKKVKDDFYDRVNYYESRNIFSSNEQFNPSNRLYTDPAANTHSVWNTIEKTNGIIDRTAKGLGANYVARKLHKISSRV